MERTGGSLRGWWRAHRPRGVPSMVAVVLVAAALLAGGIGGVVAADAPPAPEHPPIVDPIASPETAEFTDADPLEHRDAAAATAVTSSWTPPVVRRGSGGSGGGGGGGSAVLAHTNAARAANGLPALSWNGTLASRACAWARQLAAADAGLSHSSNGGGFSWWGENVASGYSSASSVVAGWMGSPGHRANILRPQFRLMGDCSATAGSGTVYWVQQFGA